MRNRKEWDEHISTMAKDRISNIVRDRRTTGRKVPSGQGSEGGTHWRELDCKPSGEEEENY